MDVSGDTGQGPDGKRTGRLHAQLRHPRLWLALAAVLVIVIGTLAVLNLTGKPLPVPEWAVSQIEKRANAALAGAALLHIGGADVVVDEGLAPRVRLRNVELLSPKGVPLAFMPELRAQLHGRALIEGRLSPETLTLVGARVSLRRLTDGNLDLSLQGGAGMAASPAQILDAIDAAFTQPALAGIETIRVERLGITLDDARTGRVWQISGGTLQLDQTRDRIEMTVGFSLGESGQRSGARADMTFTTEKGTHAAELSARLADVNSRDLAAQTPVLAWLGALDAPITGSFRSSVDPDGKVHEMNAMLTIGKGVLQPTPATRPVPFDRAEVEMRYDPAAARMTFPAVRIDSPALRAEAHGTAWLKDMATGFPSSIVGQARITRFEADPEGIFAAPVSISEGVIDVKLELAPFRLTIGQLTLIDADRRIQLSGRIGAEPAGWSVMLDAAIDAIGSDRLIALWPLSLVPQTRRWLAENVAAGELFDVKAAVRLQPGAEPRLSLGYAYRGAEVRFLRTLPPVQDGAGYSTIEDTVYTLVVERGHVTPPLGGQIDVAGSVLKVPDLRLKPTPAIIDLRTKSSVTAALSLLDEPPFEFLRKAGRPVDFAEGRAELATRLELELVKNLPLDKVSYAIEGSLLDVRSDRIVPGRVLAADRLSVRGDKAGLTISGKGTLSDVPFDAAWRQDFGPEGKGRSRVDGQVTLSEAFNTAFGIGLPQGAVSGEGSGRIALDLREGQPTGFTLDSDLQGIGLRIPEIGWSKPAAAKGALAVSGTLGTPPKIDRLALKAPGLAAEGSVTLRQGGTLDAVRLDSVDLGWFKGALDLTGRGKGKTVGIAIRSGSADLRKARFGSSGGSGDTPVTATLDRLTLSDGIALTRFRGRFSTGGGLNGDFDGRVNGKAPVSGTVVPMRGRSAFRVKSDDAGAVIAAAGIFERGRGGALDLTLRPGPGADDYDGTLRVRDIRVVNAPVLAELLGLISVVGLIEQLGGQGILFSDVNGDFRMTPDAVEIRQGSAVGASMGISAAGVYRSGARTIDLQGTISPFYLLNGVGQIISKRGEGLFGFNYRLRGPTSDPQVSVNPLSILTPGMFREIFRSAPPKAGP